MKQKLFQEVFDRAAKQSGKDSKHGLAAHLEKVFMDEFKFSVNKVTFVRYYEKYIQGNGDIGNNPNTELLDKLSQYLGFSGYEDFVAGNEADARKNGKGSLRKESFFKRHLITLIVSTLLLIGFGVYTSINTQRWMVWKEDRYVEVDFDTEKYNLGQLKIYKEERIENFRQIQPDCSTQFFDRSGEVQLWYSKNENGDVDFFTSIGKHPITGKTLKGVTEYMIKKYVCDTYNN
ncbi:hypothetical protein [Aestuariibaculum lutulentum]|uniref:Transcriptional regulator n=1 Tax=Aestuariibaculum lutulentum TaxID=2920935 RepID=A0ABS9RJ81_9FLAO|nr:hypothetical protein [Aestuariibaculum lutulentum]MCH4552214.1 hypothetical protein [Aestuariibaculum lutulentum]